MRLDLAELRAGRDGVRRQPALPRGRAARARLDRRPARRPALVRARAARDRRAPDGRARATRSTARPSVLCALALEPTGRHAVSRSVFVPVPNVDSTLVAFARRAEWGELAGDWPQIVATVRAAFAYRRKTVANALATAGWRRRSRRGRASRCGAAGIEPGARAESAAARGLRPARPARAAPDVIAGAKINLCLRVGPAARRRLPRASRPCIAALALGDDVSSSRRPRRRWTRRRSPAATRSSRARSGLLARAHRPRRRVARAHRQARPGGCGARRRERRCRRRARGSRTRRCPSRSRRSELVALAARGRLGRPVLRLGARDGARARPRRAARAVPAGRARLGRAWPGRASRSAPRRSTRATGRAPDARERVAALAAGPFASGDVEQLAALVENDLGGPAEQLCPPIAALRARLLAHGAAGRERERLGLGGVRPVRVGRAPRRRPAERLGAAAPWTAIARLTQGGGARITA